MSYRKNLKKNSWNISYIFLPDHNTTMTDSPTMKMRTKEPIAPR